MVILILLVAAASVCLLSVPATIGCMLLRDVRRDLRAAAAYVPAHGGRGLVVNVAPRLPRWEHAPRPVTGQPPWDLPDYPDMQVQLAVQLAVLEGVQLLAAVPALRPGWPAHIARQIGAGQ